MMIPIIDTEATEPSTYYYYTTRNTGDLILDLIPKFYKRSKIVGKSKSIKDLDNRQILKLLGLHLEILEARTRANKDHNAEHQYIQAQRAALNKIIDKVNHNHNHGHKYKLNAREQAAKDRILARDTLWIQDLLDLGEKRQ